MNPPNIQAIVIKSLLNNDEFLRRTIPFIREEYFEENYRIIFEEIKKFTDKFNESPTLEALGIELEQSSTNSTKYAETLDQIKLIMSEKLPTNNLDWLIEGTERWCKERALVLATLQAVNIIEGRDKKLTRSALPQLFSEALTVGFSNYVGHDYLTDFIERFDFYHRDEERLKFDLDYFNKITNGGLPNKTLNIILAGTGVGKSLFMCHFAASALDRGKNVLYITMEMAEERIAERIDANLMNITVDEVKELDKKQFTKNINKIISKVQGRLIIKEYPTGAANVNHFRGLIKELALKKNFVPDVICIDYLNICNSARLKAGSAGNSYNFIKAIAEEIRGLAVEMKVPILSATQTNREGFKNSDVGLEDTSESFGLPATADLMFALTTNDDFEKSGLIAVKQLKNRYNDLTSNKRFVIGIERAKMRLFDAPEESQGDVLNVENRPIMDQNNHVKWDEIQTS